MPVSLKPLDQQVIVLTGASSGIGLVTARMAADGGAKLVLAARNGEALAQLENEINAANRYPGGQAVHVVADVGNEADVQRIAETAVARFGGFDTWVNDAGVSIYGRIEKVSIEDHRKLFETNFWGVVYGSRVAVAHLKQRGGALINVGSNLSDRAIPLQGIYSASKHAVKGFTDALRMELEEEGAPVSVTLIKPAAIDTPYTEHAKNYLSTEPQNPPPVYAPETVARAILHAAQTPERDIFVGSAGKMFSVMEKYAPRLTDKVMEKTLFRQQHGNRPSPGRDDAGLHRPGAGLRERGGYHETPSPGRCERSAGPSPRTAWQPSSASADWRSPRPGQDWPPPGISPSETRTCEERCRRCRTRRPNRPAAARPSARRPRPGGRERYSRIPSGSVGAGPPAPARPAAWRGQRVPDRQSSSTGPELPAQAAGAWPWAASPPPSRAPSPPAIGPGSPRRQNLAGARPGASRLSASRRCGTSRSARPETGGPAPRTVGHPLRPDCGSHRG